MDEPPRYVWEDPPCLTYLEERHPGHHMWRAGCLWHQKTGPDRATEEEAQADCTRHLQVEHLKAQTIPGLPSSET